MENKKYRSCADIDAELEILKLQKEINYQKLVLSIQKTKESITPENIINGFLDPYKNLFSGPIVNIIKTAIPYIINWLLNKKRGD